MRIRAVMLSNWLDPRLREEDVHMELSTVREQTHFARCVPALRISRTTRTTFGEADYCGLSTKMRKQTHLEHSWVVGSNLLGPEIQKVRKRSQTNVTHWGVSE